MIVDVSFRINGESLPADHGYTLYAAMSRLVPAVHAENGIAIHPISGRLCGERRMTLMPWSTLSLRVAAEEIPKLLPLAGKTLELHEAKVRVGVPEVRPLVPATALRSRLVVIKVAHTDTRLLTALSRLHSKSNACRRHREIHAPFATNVHCSTPDGVSGFSTTPPPRH